MLLFNMSLKYIDCSSHVFDYGNKTKTDDGSTDLDLFSMIPQTS